MECKGCDGKGRAALPPTWASATCPDCGGTGRTGPQMLAPDRLVAAQEFEQEFKSSFVADPPWAGVQTGRVSSKHPNPGALPSGPGYGKHQIDMGGALGRGVATGDEVHVFWMKPDRKAVTVIPTMGPWQKDRDLRVILTGFLAGYKPNGCKVQVRQHSYSSYARVWTIYLQEVT